MSEKPKNPDTKEDNIEIEKRIDKELNRLRELADRELNHLHDDCNKEIKILNSIRESRWMTISIIVGIIGFIGSIVPYLVIWPHITSYIDRNLIGPELAKISSSKELFEFTLTYIKAQSDDSEAFEQLARWGYNEEFKPYPYRDIACNTYDSIRHNYLEKILPFYPIYKWQQGVEPAKFSCTEFKESFRQFPLRFHADLVRLIWESNLIDNEKMELLVDVIRNTKITNSLNAKFFAGNYLALKMEIVWQPFYYGPIMDEWDKRQGTTTTK